MRSTVGLLIAVIAVLVVSVLTTSALASSHSGPSDLQANYDGPAATTRLTWDSDVGPVDHYAIRRSAQPINASGIGSLPVLATATGNSTAADISPQPGTDGLFYYAVTSVYENGSENLDLGTNVLDVAVHEDNVAPPQVTNLTINFDPDLGRTTLHWNSSTDVAAVDLYRSSADPSIVGFTGAVLVGQFSSNTATLEAAGPGPYWYAALGRDGFGNLNISFTAVTGPLSEQVDFGQPSALEAFFSSNTTSTILTWVDPPGLEGFIEVHLHDQPADDMLSGNSTPARVVAVGAGTAEFQVPEGTEKLAWYSVVHVDEAFIRNHTLVPGSNTLSAPVLEDSRGPTLSLHPVVEDAGLFQIEGEVQDASGVAALNWSRDGQSWTSLGPGNQTWTVNVTGAGPFMIESMDEPGHLTYLELDLQLRPDSAPNQEENSGTDFRTFTQISTFFVLTLALVLLFLFLRRSETTPGPTSGSDAQQRHWEMMVPLFTEVGPSDDMMRSLHRDAFEWSLFSGPDPQMRSYGEQLLEVLESRDRSRDPTLITTVFETYLNAQNTGPQTEIFELGTSGLKLSERARTDFETYLRDVEFDESQ